MNNEAGFIRAILNINHKPKHAGPAKKLLIVREMFQDFCILNMAVHLHLYLHTHTHTHMCQCHQVHLFICSLTQISNQPSQCIKAMHFGMQTCPRKPAKLKASGWQRKVIQRTLNMTWLLVPDGPSLSLSETADLRFPCKTICRGLQRMV